MGFGILATGLSQTGVDHPGSAGTMLTTQLGLEVQEYLPLRHASYGVGCSIACGDEGGVDICPARAAAATLSSLMRSSTLNQQKGLLAPHQSDSR